MKLFKNLAGERILTVKDVLLGVWLFIIIVCCLVAVYALIWAAWTVLRTAMTVLVTACIFLSLTVSFFPEEDK
jgi:hypothetical protein